MRPRRVGILALQGDFEAHATIVRALDGEPVEARVPGDLEGLAGLIILGAGGFMITQYSA